MGHLSARRIPVHSAGLGPGDYLPYVAAPRAGRRARGQSLEALWRARLDRTLLPTPTGRHALWWFLQRHRDRLRRGDEVIVAGYNFHVVVAILRQWGLAPVFADIEPHTLCLDPERVAARTTPRTRLIVVTHMFGQPADLPALRTQAAAGELLLFEDAAHAIGTVDEAGRQVGQHGDGALFSFGIQKIVNCFGGGMLALPPGAPPTPPLGHRPTRRRALAGTLPRAVASAGLEHRFAAARNDPGYRFAVEDRGPFQDFMRPMLERQLTRLDANVATRRDLRDQLRAALRDLDAVGFYDDDAHGRANGAYLGIRVPDPGALSAFLRGRGVIATPREFLDCSRLEQFAAHAADCPRAARAEAVTLRLPCHPRMTANAAERVADGVRAFFTRA